jgi:hypothetical protein
MTKPHSPKTSPKPSVTIPPLFALRVRAAKTNVVDLSGLQTIAKDTQTLLAKGDLPSAAKRFSDFKAEWNAAQPRVGGLTIDQWLLIEDATYAAVFALRARRPDTVTARKSVAKLIGALRNPPAH